MVDVTTKKRKKKSDLLLWVCETVSDSETWNRPLFLQVLTEQGTCTTPLLYVCVLSKAKSMLTAHTELPSHPFECAIILMAKINSCKPRHQKHLVKNTQLVSFPPGLHCKRAINVATPT